MTKKNEDEDTALAKEGLEFINLSAAEVAKWHAAALDSHWAEIVTKSPKYGEALKKYAD